ncbi:probable tRNA N6-adenosine threonylcarbamoyltransferase, mitochondrial [Centruroides sculpturatus]|uniref:probable tRNA N6-adenosine threonylcarbamoyltransferase, mitochondrial n=1 Tax=Centruroides sculpturatus TaxID=218467 RepID=UPI000C6CFA64|nr:probable tRNA N6-adenosine threonylcarbamoyltransferase, mitochondrial [Centruroides sculpturatus]
MYKIFRCLLPIRYGELFECKIQNKRYLARTVLGIETSCDDTGAAVVDEFGNVLGEALSSQHQFHLDNGGIIPTFAKYLHRNEISKIVQSALDKSNITLKDVSAIATTVKPGLKESLLVGLNYSKSLIQDCRKPFLPIHHMEAHALVIRMIELVEFPFLVLLASGGHCQIALVQNVNKFLLLGTTIDCAPGEVLDKKVNTSELGEVVILYVDINKVETCFNDLESLPSEISFYLLTFLCIKFNIFTFLTHDVIIGKSVCDSLKFDIVTINTNCKSMGLRMPVLYDIVANKFSCCPPLDIVADGIIPNVSDLCASVLYILTKQLVRQVQRAIMFCKYNNLIPENRQTLVFSGGVACNEYIRLALNKLCNSVDWRFTCPPPKLCNDNGIMIAWNGMEYLKAGIQGTDAKEISITTK